ncbi:MAG: Rrf2 family transcriptional regulator [Candidatus Omnitrophica bacterium CG12_big_fil_rev_8_21_14_0_65_43_15]|uniref:Rrf2 family transcriptional regulator n=1 Tax=Candidatus Taenaricola geysiri TaxID=1974752 RepID=A0A2J0LJL9_9BACT|nr:MAG: Rrf2 family transcriptional regulator [Candidatus Omnitrophica bacterium CG12_big_fil_rev_8_21_14_0_65_43_15]PIW80079.1 MAG: Rrf2 family transcriptional regulator [Candidatus Omnitrophica bacterium CG_4_8_14_3_um_filter_43_15]PIY84643.1 MAG: Rrf2 family transcriptional regulator [Candidatus Omnitrophica bacterium CG_4_10_14_0_8_um_filter_43_18]PJC46017.1 MAG: Rrf2 family transcriptional regulator [Candidatus Omnitrophica bacterium CG_4_9_14_0_2_um_filter_43_12]
MRISARCDYACKALLELALHWPSKEPVQLHTISDHQGIPTKYLVHILIQLKRMNLVESMRGKQGGYNLTRHPNEITLGEVIRDTGGPLLPLAKTAVKSESAFAAIWEEVEGVMAKVLDKVTFEDIVNKVRGKEKALIYQI